MSFRDQLDKAHKCAIDLGAAFIAQEVSEYEGFSCVLTPEEFEHICNLVYDLWNDLDYSISALVSTIGHLVSTNSYKPLELNRNIIMENYYED